MATKAASSNSKKTVEEQPTAPKGEEQPTPDPIEEQPTAPSPATPPDPNHSAVRPIRGAETNELPARISEPITVELPNGTTKVTY